MEKQRCYFVIDMKSFFASVECAERGLDAMTTKLIVADNSRTETTICLAVTPALKKLGVKNRCRLYEIPKNLDYIVAVPRMKKYIEYASKIYEIYLKYIDKSDIHVYSIDECILDVTDYLKLYKTRAKPFAQKLMSEINDTLKIPSTCGIGSNMYLAKIALDLTAKHSPDRIGWLDEQKFLDTLWQHKPLTDFWGIAQGISQRLAKYNITCMKDIATINPEILYKEFGINAELIIDHAWGRETCLMSDIKNYKGKSKSISNSQILACNYNVTDGKIVFYEMIQEACYRLMKDNYIASNLVLYIGYGDEKRSIDKGSIKFSIASNLFSQIIPYAEKLFDEIVDAKTPIRRIGISFGGLLEDKFTQLDLFTDQSKLLKEKNLVKCILDIKDKFGKNIMLKGIDFFEKATQRERNEQIGGHRSGENENAKNKSSCAVCTI